MLSLSLNALCLRHTRLIWINFSFAKGKKKKRLEAEAGKS